MFCLVRIFCTVENLAPNKLYKSVKVRENYRAWDFLHLALIYTGFTISPDPSIHDREFGFNQEPFTIPDEIKIVGHLLSKFPPDIVGPLMYPSWNNRIRFKSITDKPVHFLGVISMVHDIALRFMEFTRFLQKYECVFWIVNPVITCRSVSIEIDVSRKCFRIFPVLSE